MTLFRRSFLAACLLPTCLSIWPVAASAQRSAESAAPPMAHTPFPTGDTTPLGAKIAALVSDPMSSRTHWGIAVTALDGTPIYGFREGELYRPASNNKLFTSAAAMSLLGPDSKVTTSLFYPNPDKKGVVKSNLSIMGAGDANLSGEDLPYLSPAQKKAAIAAGTWVAPDPLKALDDFAAQVAKAGVKKIEGDIVGDDKLWTYEPYPTAWDIGDMLTGDGAPVSALSIADNELVLKIAPGAKEGDPAIITMTPEIGYYKVDSSVTTGPAATPGEGFGRAGVDVSRAPGARTLRIFGTIALGSQPRTSEIAIADPAEFAAIALKQKLIAHGIEVSGSARAEHRLPTDAAPFFRETHVPLAFSKHGEVAGAPTGGILTHTSPTLAEDAYMTLKVSQNLHAELMLQRLGAAYGDPTMNSTAQGVRVVRQFLVNAGVDGEDFIFYDGSGMSSHDLVAPRAAAQLLKYAATQPWFSQWKASLPVGGVDGTISSRFTDPPLLGHVFAKTGTLGESRGLSGYLDCASGKQVIFSIMADDHNPGSQGDRIIMDKIVAAIAASE